MKLTRNKLLFLLILNLLFCEFILTKPIHKKQTYKIHAEAPTPTDKKMVLHLYQLMKDVHEVLLVNKIEYWVIGGTLLGAVRHKGLIPWDDDLDICISKQQIDNFLALTPVFERLGYEVVYWDQRYDLYRIRPQSTKFPFIDIFLYKQKDNKIFYGWTNFKKCRKDKNVAIYANELFPLKDYDFGKISVKGPNEPLKYLECCYGSDFLDVAYYGQNHQGEPISYKKIKLNEKDKIPAEPMGPLQNNVLNLLSNAKFEK